MSESPIQPTDQPTEEAGRQGRWLQRLRQGLSRSATQLSEGVGGIFAKRRLDDETLEELEDLLIQADLGVETAAELCAEVARGRYNKEVTPEEIRAILAEEIAKRLEPVDRPVEVPADTRPVVFLFVGVNGTGKTTTIGKLAARMRRQGRTVMLAACDTFRAAAIEQLQIWGERVGVPVVARALGADAAGLAFDAFQRARAEGVDMLLIDTAGRMQNKAGLMAELEKITRVLKKLDPTAPHAVVLVLDATTGQNALSQVEVFAERAGVTGLTMTKLDGTARGGILVALAHHFGLPVYWVGIGEAIEDLQPFEPRAFARALTGAAAGAAPS